MFKSIKQKLQGTKKAFFFAYVGHGIETNSGHLNCIVPQSDTAIEPLIVFDMEQEMNIISQTNKVVAFMNSNRMSILNTQQQQLEKEE